MPKLPSRRSTRGYQRGPHLYRRALPGGGVGFYAYLPSRPGGVSLRTADPVVAEQRFRALLAHPDAPSAELGRSVRAPELTLVEIARRYLDEPHGWTTSTKRSTRVRIKAFGRWCAAHGIELPSELTDARLSEWITERSKFVSRRTVNRDLRPVRLMLAWAAAPERAYAAPSPVATRKGLREPKRSKVRYVPDGSEFARAAAALEELHQGAALAVRALYATGLRIEELRRLQVFDVRAGVVYVRPEEGPADTAEPTKGYRERAVPVAPAVEQLVRAFLAWRSGTGGKGKRVGCTESWLIKKLHAAQQIARVPTFGLHDLRAAFATEAFDRGIGLVVIQRWMGHADPQTTQGYIRPRRSDAAVQAPVPEGLFEVPKGPKSRAESVLKAGGKSG